MAFQVNPYQTSVGDPNLGLFRGGAMLQDVLKQRQNEVAMQNLQNVIKGGGGQTRINEMLNRGVAGGADANLMNQLRGTTPDADAAAAYKADLLNKKMIAETARTGRQDLDWHKLSPELRDIQAAQGVGGLEAVRGKVDALDAIRNRQTTDVLGLTPQVAGGDRTGGTRSWRNKNVGNLKYGDYAKRHGATGQDAQGFAIFPDEATGDKARSNLLFNTSGYKNLTAPQMIARYAPASDNNDTKAYAATLARAGVPMNVPMSQLNPAQRTAMLGAMKKHEGYKAGTGGLPQPTQRPITNEAAKYLLEQGKKAPSAAKVGGANLLQLLDDQLNVETNPIKRKQLQQQKANLTQALNIPTTATALDVPPELIESKAQTQMKEDVITTAGGTSPKQQAIVNTKVSEKYKFTSADREQIANNSWRPDRLTGDKLANVIKTIDDMKIDVSWYDDFPMSSSKENRESIQLALQDEMTEDDYQQVISGNTTSLKNIFGRMGLTYDFESAGSDFKGLTKPLEDAVETREQSRNLDAEIAANPKWSAAKKTSKRTELRKLQAQLKTVDFTEAQLDLGLKLR